MIRERNRGFRERSENFVQFQDNAPSKTKKCGNRSHRTKNTGLRLLSHISYLLESRTASKEARVFTDKDKNTVLL